MDDVEREIFIETSSGCRVDLPCPKPGQVKIGDIAYALARQCRFNGHCRQFYSVAQHSVLVSRLLDARGYTVEVQMAGLLHDAAEAYVGDLVQPVKLLLPDFAAIEGTVQNAILEQLEMPITGLRSEQIARDAVKDADLTLLATEADALLPSRGRDWQLPVKAVAGLLYEYWGVLQATRRFLGIFYKLSREINEARTPATPATPAIENPTIAISK